MLRVLALCAGVFAFSLAGLGGWAVMAAGSSPLARLPPQAQRPFERYLEVPHRLGYRAFVVEPESGAWGKASGFGQPGIAVEQALADCRRRARRDCQAYAVGDMIVLGFAAWKIEVAVVLYRVKRGAGNDDLEAATSSGGGEAVTAGAVALKRALLHAAAEMGYPGTVAAMLDRGVGVDAGSEIGATALSYAASRGHREVVALLLARGADVNARNGVGKTALGVAMLANVFAQPRGYLAADHDAVIRLILDAGGVE